MGNNDKLLEELLRGYRAECVAAGVELLSEDDLAVVARALLTGDLVLVTLH